MVEDFEGCYRAVQSRDARFDGWFFTAVTSTHIYCRPSCPAMTPKRANVRFYPSAAAAQAAGFRACLRCRPDAAPGSPEWDTRADVAARAMRLITDGAVDRHGVAGLAGRLGYSERQLHRVLVAELGTGALPLARAQRAQTARVLLETTELPAAQIAFAAGFASVRQFNDTVRQVFASTPTGLRRRRPAHTRREVAGAAAGAAQGPGAVALRLAYRRPFHPGSVFDFLAARTVAGVESVEDGTYRRSLRLPHGQAVAELFPGDGHVRCVLRLEDLRDLTTAVSRCRRLLDLDADPVAVCDVLGRDPFLRPLVRRAPGRRMPATVDGPEMLIRAVVGQQVSVAGARTVLGRLASAAGPELVAPLGAVTHCFPDPGELAHLAAAEPGTFAMPASRRRALELLCAAMASGELVLDPGTERTDLEARLLAHPGIGPWTSAYVSMRALGDPDAFLPTDMGVRRAAAALGHDDGPAALLARAERWRPWRSYAMAYLWGAAGAPTKTDDRRPLKARSAA